MYLLRTEIEAFLACFRIFIDDDKGKKKGKMKKRRVRKKEKRREKEEETKRKEEKGESPAFSVYIFRFATVIFEAIID